jgi:hypothetical protein
MTHLMSDTYLKEHCSKLICLSEYICSKLKGDLDNDLLFMCRVFAERQISQMKSILLLADRDDAILISRSMFEGALYLAYSIKNKEMARRWRLFSIIIDKRRADESVLSGENVPEKVKSIIAELLPECNKYFLKKNGTYCDTWKGNKKIRSIAEEIDVKFVELYDNHYSPMSDYHHWGTASLGKRYSITRDDISVCDTDEVKVERDGALLMALSCLLSTIKVACELFKIGEIDRISEMEKCLGEIHGNKTNEIHISG